MREFIVEADGGSRGNPGPAGYGAVVIDAATGETLAQTAEYLGVVTNNVAEYRGLLAGLRAAQALDPTASVRVRMDSKLVVEQMSGRWKIKHPDMKPLAMEAGRVFPVGRVTYEWIPRDQNRHADRLANEAMDAGARGEAWTPSPVAGTSVVTSPEGPPGDAAAGAARARAALAGRSSAGSPSQPVSAPAGSPSASERVASPAGSPPASEEAVSAPAGAAQARAASAGRSSAGSPSQPASAPAGTSPAPEPPASAPVASGVDVNATSSSADVNAASPDADVNAARNVATPRVGWGAPDLGAPATFVLLRHGETPLTPEKRFSGSGGSDPALSDIGREQAERVAVALARRGTIQAVVASPLARTRETAGIVAARLGLEVGIDDGLRETDFGAWEGLTFAEVHQRYPDDLSAWLASPDAEPTGGGESFAATATRIAATRDKLIAAYAGRTVLLVTHVTPIKTLVRLALGAPPESLFRMELAAASLSVVAYYADGNASVRLLNDTSHLR
ncbi:bifunctional RNase H/acid phosphatase [Streptomyces spinoverrucosus]|uniref:Bifunctional RNase H/acid phosphatase n=1 Tax=Streptomyces spinoverrucosus TaxID=284043 RepID=A0A4Y3VU57_9ACTN|nr:bifunctional RNase H/acid phosphatase [Streptomyces spinoverrucosus]GEC09209.1 bifunctional RNase H/acid phosphatase [Streptomyces spinoverrucosus]GHB66347.1 bifunctional RNase H/acid phosphatase [Streptomyces spinoverrucosus]